MPVSGNEESGVVARQPSCLSAGVPIKKRRFPLIQPSSPPPQESSSGPVENHSLQNKCSSLGQDFSFPNCSIAANSSEKSVAIKKFVSEVKKEAVTPEKYDTCQTSFAIVKRENPAVSNVNLSQSKFSLAIPKTVEEKSTNDSESMNIASIKEKLMLADNSAGQSITSNDELHVAPSEAPAINVGKEKFSGQQVEKGYTFEFSMMMGNAELSLGPKELLVPAFAGQSSDGNGQIHANADTSSLKLSLGEGKSRNQCRSSNSMSSEDDNILHANRSNWDLNTTMDAWDGSGGDTAAHTVVFSETILSSTTVAATAFDAGKLLFLPGELESNSAVTSIPLNMLYESGTALHLSLGTSTCLLNSSGDHSCPPDKVDFGRVNSDTNEMVSTGGIITSARKNVKSEPIDENDKLDSSEDKDRLMDVKSAKQELYGKYSTETDKLSNVCFQKLDECRSIKSELVQEDNQGTHRPVESTSQLYIEKDGESQHNHSTLLTMPPTKQKSCPLRVTPHSELSLSGDAPSQSEYSTSNENVNVDMPRSVDNCRSVYQVSAELVSQTADHRGECSNASDDKINTSRDSNADDMERYRLKAMDNLQQESHGHGDESASDEEKINISTDMMEEDSYGSDFDSEGRQRGSEDYEYEDGEVREPQADLSVEDVVHEEREAENDRPGVLDDKNMVSSVFARESNMVQSQVSEEDSKVEYHEETAEVHVKECLDSVSGDKAEQVINKDGCLQDSCNVKVADSDDKVPISVSHRKILNHSRKKASEQSMENELSSEGVIDGSEADVPTVHVTANNSEVTETTGKTQSNFPTAEASLDGNEFCQDVNNGANRSRIINLPRASNETSAGKTLSIQGRPLLSRTGKEINSDFEGGKLHTRGNRDEIYTDGPRKFVRERIPDQTFRNSRMNFPRGRGRLSSRLDSLRGEWDSDRNFAPKLYNGPVDYRFSRHRRAVADIDLDCDGYVLDSDGAVVDTSRGARKPLNDEIASFHHQSSRRLSPRGRDGTETGMQVVRRISRNISPSRCTGEDGTELVGLRQAEKFMRGLEDDMIDPVFARSEPQYERLDSQFVRGRRNFPSLQRRGVPQLRSKSPVRPRARSPGPWPSPRRRSPDGFTRIPELTRQRSPAFYRKERMRSPNRTCFPEDIVGRRRGSPLFIGRAPNDLRELESGQDHGHPRSVIPNRRSPSDRVLSRNSRRFDILDPRERPDSDEYFGGPMRSGRFHELGNEGTADERRKCGERRGVVRPYRPADDDSFRFHLEDGPRPFRFCPETDSEFMERSNLRGRQFDRRVKTGRVRSIDEQEGNFRQRGRVWHDDDGFDDVSRVKRRRF